MPEMQLPARLHRAASFAVRAEPVEGDDKRVALSFSSEEPVMRWFGWEVLGHGADEVNLVWANSGRAPLLADHRNAIAAVLGVVESAAVEGGKGRAVVRFGDHAEAQDALTKVRAGVLGNVSVGYSIEELTRWKASADGEDTYRATRWTVREISLVAAPADTSVGVGREAPAETVIITLKEAEMAEKTDQRDAPVKTPAAPTPTPQRDDKPADVKAMLEDARKAERERCAEIERIGAAHNIPRAARERAVAEG
ncbi:MAG: HK97 family phage prohead protease, partial [Rubrimonas sp.]